MQQFVMSALKLFFGPGVQSYLAEFEKITGYKLNEEQKAPFLAFHRYITDPQPRFITEFRSNPKAEHWYHLLVNGVLGNVQRSFACVHYHQSRLLSIESELMERIQRLGGIDNPSGLSMSLGDTAVLDFEYQAYVMAYRRCLDQFATAIAAFFKNSFHSFRRLPDFLSRRKPREVALAITQVLPNYATAFEFVMSDNGGNSVRDRIAHMEFVPVGCFNLHQSGVVLIGGGENLNLNGSGDETLHGVITKKTENLHRCISEVIEAFIDAASAWEISKEMAAPPPGV